jgi:hypothetical protein
MLANGIVHDFVIDVEPAAGCECWKRKPRAAPRRGGTVAGLAGRMRHTRDAWRRCSRNPGLGASRGSRAGTPGLGAGAKECVEMLAPRFEASGVAAELRMRRKRWSSGRPRPR